MDKGSRKEAGVPYEGFSSFPYPAPPAFSERGYFPEQQRTPGLVLGSMEGFAFAPAVSDHQPQYLYGGGLFPPSMEGAVPVHYPRRSEAEESSSNRTKKETHSSPRKKRSVKDREEGPHSSSSGRSDGAKKKAKKAAKSEESIISAAPPPLKCSYLYSYEGAPANPMLYPPIPPTTAPDMGLMYPSSASLDDQQQQQAYAQAYSRQPFFPMSAQLPPNVMAQGAFPSMPSLWAQQQMSMGGYYLPSQQQQQQVSSGMWQQTEDRPKVDTLASVALAVAARDEAEAAASMAALGGSMQQYQQQQQPSQQQQQLVSLDGYRCKALLTPVPANSRNTARMSNELRSRVARERSGFLDDLGYGDWTTDLNPKVYEDRLLIIELLERLYNRPEAGHFIHEIFGNRHKDKEGVERMCDSYLSQLLLIAKARISVFSTLKPESNAKQQYYVCYDTPAVYDSIPHYFDVTKRHNLSINGTGGGRKRKKGAPKDFREGEDYFRSRTRLLDAIRRNPERFFDYQ